MAMQSFGMGVNYIDELIRKYYQGSNSRSEIIRSLADIGFDHLLLKSSLSSCARALTSGKPNFLS